jgi:hypothetical protein
LAISSLALLAVGLTFYLRYVDNNQDGNEVLVTAIINYGSLKLSSEEVYNVTIENGSTALQVFVCIADIELQNYSLGSYIRSVNGYTEQLPNYWAFYYFDFDSQTWAYSAIGVDQFKITNGSKIKLEYTG